MKQSEWPTEIDPEFERRLEEVLDLKGVKYTKESPTDWGTIAYEIQTRPSLDLELTFQLHADQVEISFDGCYLLLELAFHVPKFGENPNAIEEWQEKCLSEIGAILDSDLKVRSGTRLGRVLGGYLYRRVGNRWHNIGGAMLIPFTYRKRVKVYRSWLA